MTHLPDILGRIGALWPRALARAGEQMGTGVNAFSKTTPSAASEST